MFKNLIIVATLTCALVACSNSNDEDSNNTDGQSTSNSSDTAVDSDVQENDMDDTPTIFGYPNILGNLDSLPDDIQDWYNLSWYNPETTPPSATIDDVAMATTAAAEVFDLLSIELHDYANRVIGNVEAGIAVSSDPLVQQYAEEFHSVFTRNAQPCAEYENGVLVSHSCSVPSGNQLIYEVPTGGKLLVKYLFFNANDDSATIIHLGNSIDDDPLLGYGVLWQLARRTGDDGLSVMTTRAFNQGQILNQSDSDRVPTANPAALAELVRGIREATRMMNGLRTGMY